MHSARSERADEIFSPTIQKILHSNGGAGTITNDKSTYARHYHVPPPAAAKTAYFFSFTDTFMVFLLGKKEGGVAPAVMQTWEMTKFPFFFSLSSSSSKFAIECSGGVGIIYEAELTRLGVN